MKRVAKRGIMEVLDYGDNKAFRQSCRYVVRRTDTNAYLEEFARREDAIRWADENKNN